MGSRAWWATVHRITKSQTQLSTNTYTKGVGEAGGMLAPVLLRSWIYQSWSSNTLATWCKQLIIGNNTEAGKDWRQEKKWTIEDEMVGRHHRLDGHELEQALGVGDGQGSLACCSPWRCKESDMTKWLNWIEYIVFAFSLDLELYKKWISLGIHFFLAWTVAGATHTMRCRLSWTWHMKLGSGVSNYPI